MHYGMEEGGCLDQMITQELMIHTTKSTLDFQLDIKTD